MIQDIISYPWGCYYKSKTKQETENYNYWHPNVEKFNPWGTAGRNVKRCIWCGKQHGSFQKKLKKLKKISIELPQHPTTPLLGIYTQKNWKQVLKHVYSRIFHNSWKVETTQMSTDRRMDKPNMVIHIMEYYSALQGKKFWHVL